jgi:hypothetical protein
MGRSGRKTKKYGILLHLSGVIVKFELNSNYMVKSTDE